MTTFQCSQHIANSIIKNCTGKTLLLLSGGSSAKVGIKVLQLLPQEILQKVTVALCDERFVAFDSPDSNWNLLTTLGINEIDVKKIAVLPRDSEDRQRVALDYSEALKTELTNSQHVVAILGLGVDNHTAGILPNTEASHTTNLLTFDYATDNFERITITPAFFTNIDFAFLYTEGAEKKSAVELLNNDLDPVAYPSQLIKNTKSWEVLYNEEAL
jgi:6-phosphogluconolactonase/glucosamine-6-phosphate isomerase/deaminase